MIKNKENYWMCGSTISYDVLLFDKSPWEIVDFESECDKILDENKVYFFNSYDAAIEFANTMLLADNKYVYATIDFLEFDEEDNCTEAFVIWEAGIEEYKSPEEIKSTAKTALN